MLRQLARVITLGLLAVTSVGCCCVQGMPGNGRGSCGTGMCGSGPLMGLASCRGACGEVYVDEWVSEPPVVDQCGDNCGGCQRCYQPVRNVLRMLWGRPYRANCDTGLCAPSCDGGCDSYSGSGGYAGETYWEDGQGGEVYHGGGHAPAHGGSSCNCGSSHAAPMTVGPTHSAPQMAPPFEGEPQPAPPMPRGSNGKSVPQVAPETQSTPPATVAPTSAARRLNPALSRMR